MICQSSDHCELWDKGFITVIRLPCCERSQGGGGAARSWRFGALQRAKVGEGRACGDSPLCTAAVTVVC